MTAPRRCADGSPRPPDAGLHGYNAQDVEALLARVSNRVDWPYGADGLHGKQAVRAYWNEQWTRTRTHGEPVSFSELDDGRTAVHINQVVRSLEGSVMFRGHFLHMHRSNAISSRVDIEAVPGA